MNTLRITTTTLMLLLAAGLTFAEGMNGLSSMSNMNNMNGMPMSGTMAPQSATQVHHAMGIVKNVDTAAGRVTITHGPINSIPWPAMTMGFPVKDKAMLDQITVGEKVDFDLMPAGKDQFMVIRINPAHG